MGLVTLGEWPDREYITIQRGQKFGIAGALGERITKVDVVFQSLGDNSRALELVISTSEGRRKRIVSSELLPGYVPCTRVLYCGKGEEIMGVHGVIKVSDPGYLHTSPSPTRITVLMPDGVVERSLQ